MGGGIGMVIVVVIALISGQDLGQILGLLSNSSGTTQQQQGPGVDDETKQFVGAVTGYTEAVWEQQFKEMGRRYEKPDVILYSGRTHTGAGMVADCRLGPFYLPASKEIFIDPTFFQELSSQLGAPGDFAQAYVIAHEVGHHVQHLLGTSGMVHREQQRVPKLQANQLSVRLELQADFLAGFWAQHAQKKWRILEEGDIEEALTAAHSIGDDRLQKRAGGRVNEDAFTHGTSEQRIRWFTKGFRARDLREKDDTFSLPYGRL